MLKTLQFTTIAAGLCLLSGFAVAQDDACSSDADCADRTRCEIGLVPVCENPPCDDAPAGRCVDESEGEACMTDDDCGGDLICVQMVAISNCPEDEPDCGTEPTAAEGYCGASNIAASGLAPEPAMGDEGGAGQGVPEVLESGAAPESNSGGSSGGCSIGGQTGGQTGWLSLAAVLGLAARRRRR